MPPRATKSQKAPGTGSASAATPGTPSLGAHATGSQSGGTPAPEEGPQITQGGTYTLQQVIVGCKVFVQKPDPATGEIEERQAEILSVREKPKPKRKLDTGTGTSKDVEELPMEERLEYYVHYSEFNKRLDEWVPGKRLITSRDMVQPAPTAAAQGHGSQSNATNSRKKMARPSVPGTPGTPTPSARTASSGNLLKKAALAAAQEAGMSQLSQDAAAASKARAGSVDSDEESLTGAATPKADVEMSDGTMAGPNAVGEDAAVVSMEMVGDADAEGDDEPGTPGVSGPTTSLHPNARPLGTFSKAAEIEKLRTSGSMTQSVHEVSRVKNLNRIIMGAHEIETWYFSPYPVEYAHLDVLYVCEMCLGYFPSSFLMTRHRKKCGLVHPPGNEIYRHEDISFFEIDGRRQKTWCRNLCLLSKCFLDHKTLYYDVDPFLYYIMAQRDDAGVHIIGYFSKEKESAENYNVACILTLPQHQRAGFGKLLIEFSYELTKREHKLGSPEKPLSDLGLLGYRAYWAEIIVEVLLRTEEEISIDEIANRTAIVHADILHTCTALNMLKHYQGKHYLVLNDAVLQNHEKQVKKKRRRIVPERLNWEPPKFSRDQLRFGW